MHLRKRHAVKKAKANLDDSWMGEVNVSLPFFQTGTFIPPKFDMEPKNEGLEDIFPF